MHAIEWDANSCNLAAKVVFFNSSRRAPRKAEQGEATLFDKIVAKQIPATILYEDETALAFK